MNNLVGNIIEVEVDERLREYLGEDGYNFLYRFAFNNGHRVLFENGVDGVDAVSSVQYDEETGDVSFTVKVEQ